jgi:D-glycero-D-manno-heptose 1,7-bisphosphate phosphatase
VKPAGLVVLDRDGTINVERHYLSDPAGVELLPGAAAGIRHLRALGLPVVVVTNQSGVGRGMFTGEAVEAVHRRLRELLVAAGAEPDGIYVCPHHPGDGCACRKPGTGLLEQAARDHGVSLDRAFVVGDKECDIDAGRRAGATTLLVRTGYGEQTLQQAAVRPDHVVSDLEEAAAVIRGLLAAPEVRALETPQRERARAHLLESARVKQAIAEQCLDAIVAASAQLARALRSGGKVMFCGNGGSASDSLHLAAELTNRLTAAFERPPLAALALSADPCFLTAHANDYGFATVFSRQIEALGRPGDLLVAITTSGGSENVLRAVAAARARGIYTVGLTGGTGGALAGAVDLPIIVPDGRTAHVQEGHIAIGHVLVDLTERLLFTDRTPSP